MQDNNYYKTNAWVLQTGLIPQTGTNCPTNWANPTKWTNFGPVCGTDPDLHKYFQSVPWGIWQNMKSLLRPNTKRHCSMSKREWAMIRDRCNQSPYPRQETVGFEPFSMHFDPNFKLLSWCARHIIVRVTWRPSNSSMRHHGKHTNQESTLSTTIWWNKGMRMPQQRLIKDPTKYRKHQVPTS